MKEIPKIYNAKDYEDKIYDLWEKSGFFNPDKIKSTKRYCNILPPPNANGELHLGHATGYAVMDIFGRFERMFGKKVLLFPGKDHAGIQSQVVYEKKIKAERGISRNVLGREKFYKEIYDFCIDRSQYMRSQEKKIGLSADWSREKFTLNPEVLNIALETFVKMHSDGLIYRGKRIINWCPRCSTALSDVEVIHTEKEGKIYHIKYPLKSEEKSKIEYITVATTRPETMLGDTAIAVNSKDARYKKLVGKMVILPLQNREIPIISDRRVEMEFGTGMVKITPAHDLLDWAIGQDHELPEIQVINEKAQISQLGGKYQGQDVLEARKNILEDLSQLGFLEKEENYLISQLASVARQHLSH
jgi:valyl-tRNA synthetase